MATGYDALDHPNNACPVRGDGRYWGYRTRREIPSGAIVVHSTEGIPDYNPPDYSAENTSRYFQSSTRPASYHRITDSDTIVKFLPFDHVAFHDATGGNNHSIGVSMGTQAHTWGSGHNDHEERMLVNCARAIAEAARWWASLAANRDPMTCARWINATQYRARIPGMIEHGEVDPSRRSDPWTHHRLRADLRARLVVLVRRELLNTGEDDMPYSTWPQKDKDELAEDVAQRVAYKLSGSQPKNPEKDSEWTNLGDVINEVRKPGSSGK